MNRIETLVLILTLYFTKACITMISKCWYGINIFHQIWHKTGPMYNSCFAIKFVRMHGSFSLSLFLSLYIHIYIYTYAERKKQDSTLHMQRLPSLVKTWLSNRCKINCDISLFCLVLPYFANSPRQTLCSPCLFCALCCVLKQQECVSTAFQTCHQ